MTTREHYELRAATDDDWPTISDLLGAAFNDEFDEETSETERIVFEPDRTVLAVTRDAPDDAEEIAGVSAAFTRDLVVPGGMLPAAHVTMVSVGATHRRRGLLNRMIDKLHADAAGLGEPIAVLWASEGRIYQRYGYGLASRNVRIDARTGEIAFRDPGRHDEGRIRTAAAGSAEVFGKLYDQVLADRPGWSRRDDRWWRYVLADPKEWRGGGTMRRAVVHEGPDGIVDGYLLWRVKGGWGTGGPDGTAQIRELIATTPAAYRALYEFALRIDLTRAMSVSFAATDEPLQFLVSDPRRLEMRMMDAMWLRILDVPVALAGRRYAAPVDLVIEVEDPAIAANAGRFRLIGDRHTATCTPTDAPADLRLDVQALGAAYLGGASLVALADGGRVHEMRSGTLAPASTAFGWDRAPSATEVF